MCRFSKLPLSFFCEDGSDWLKKKKKTSRFLMLNFPLHCACCSFLEVSLVSLVVVAILSWTFFSLWCTRSCARTHTHSLSSGSFSDTHTHTHTCMHATKWTCGSPPPPPIFFSLYLFLKCFNYFFFLPCFSRLGQAYSHKVALLFHLEYHPSRNAVQLPTEKSKCLSQWNGTSLPGRRLSQNVLEKYHPLKNAVQ